MRPEASAGRRRGLLILGLGLPAGAAGRGQVRRVLLWRFYRSAEAASAARRVVLYLPRDQLSRRRLPAEDAPAEKPPAPGAVSGPCSRSWSWARSCRIMSWSLHWRSARSTRRTCRMAASVSPSGWRKKALLADALAGLVTGIWGDLASLTVLSAWLGLIGYALQLYFDFSGYSDMAIGLGRMLGFRFPENFRYPYLCSSISDFWRRWHISLGSWFRRISLFPPRRQPAGERCGRCAICSSSGWRRDCGTGRAGTTCCGACIFRRAHLLGKLLAPRFRAHPRKGLLAELYRPVCLLLAVLGWVLFRRRICLRPGGILPACSAAQPGRTRRRGCICMISGPYCFSVQLARRRCARSSPVGSARSCSRASARQCRPFWCWHC